MRDSAAQPTSDCNIGTSFWPILSLAEWKGSVNQGARNLTTKQSRNLTQSYCPTMYGCVARACGTGAAVLHCLRLTVTVREICALNIPPWATSLSPFFSLPSRIMVIIKFTNPALHSAVSISWEHFSPRKSFEFLYGISHRRARRGARPPRGTALSARNANANTRENETEKRGHCVAGSSFKFQSSLSAPHWNMDRFE